EGPGQIPRRSADATAQIEDPFAPVERQQPGKLDRCGAAARMQLIDRLEVIRRQALDVLSGRRERGEDHGAQIGGAKAGAGVMSADRWGVDRLGVSLLRLSWPKVRSPLPRPAEYRATRHPPLAPSASRVPYAGWKGAGRGGRLPFPEGGLSKRQPM